MGEVDRPSRSGGLKLIQLEHRLWVKHNFPKQTRQQIFMGMTEELGELAHHLLKREQGIRGEGVDHEAEIRDACADLIIFMMGLADLEGFVLMDAVEEAWTEVKDRDWVRFPRNGVDE